MVPAAHYISHFWYNGSNSTFYQSLLIKWFPQRILSVTTDTSGSNSTLYQSVTTDKMVPTAHFINHYWYKWFRQHTISISHYWYNGFKSTLYQSLLIQWFSQHIVSVTTDTMVPTAHGTSQRVLKWEILMAWYFDVYVSTRKIIQRIEANIFKNCQLNSALLFPCKKMNSKCQFPFLCPLGLSYLSVCLRVLFAVSFSDPNDEFRVFKCCSCNVQCKLHGEFHLALN